MYYKRLALFIYFMAAQYIYLLIRGQELKPRWVDWLDPNDQDMDIFFDRLVIITFEETSGERRFLAPGAIITSLRVVTSFNPFRNLKQDDFKKVKIGVLATRTITDWKDISYNVDYRPLTCAREILPRKRAHWHDINSTIHSPMHDLMVLRADQIWFPHEAYYNTSHYGDYSFNKFNKTGNSTLEASPLKTFLASMSMPLGRELKFASLGFKDDKHISDSCFLHSVEFKTDDNALEDCEEWIPREWGYFICIKNTADFKGVGSGAMLFHGNELFGVGSFLLQKGGKSILVFTDVRPYRQLIYRACGDAERDYLKDGEPTNLI